MRALIVEDERRLADAVARGLTADGFTHSFWVRAGAVVANRRDKDQAARGSDFFVQESKRFALRDRVVVKVGRRVVFVFD